MYGVQAISPSPLPPHGPAIVVCDHTTLGDPLVLMATVDRPIRFLMAKEIYDQPLIRWAFKAHRCIPVRRGQRDVPALRALLGVLAEQGVIGLSPEGGLDCFREEEGYPGIGYLALKSGAPVFPASIVWDRPRPLSILGTLFKPCQAHVAFGQPFSVPSQNHPKKSQIKAVTTTVMEAIAQLRNGLLVQKRKGRHDEG